jgi:hypothetical protein
MLPFLVNYRIMKCILDVEAFDESSLRRFTKKMMTFLFERILSLAQICVKIETEY